MLASFALGLGHAFEVDHLAAVSAFVATGPRRREAAWFGARWALGHGFSLLLFGSTLFLLRLAVAPGLAQVFERLVGAALLGLGVFTLLRLRRAVGHSHPHPHSHSHSRSHSHDHSSSSQRHGPLWIGALHGVAGTAAFVGQAIVVTSQSFGFVVFYTLAFSLGVLVSMSLFASVLGAVFRRTGRGTQVAMALWACIVGAAWLFRF